MKEIVQKENPVLREKAKTVPLELIESDKIKTVIKNMKEALQSQEDGVAIAAPQIGESLRIFVVSGRVYHIMKKDSDETKDIKYPDEIYINPEITKISRRKHKVEEGCLSVRWLYGKVKRAEKVTVEAFDENGKKISRGGSGLMAQIFQHEVDHLDGVLFIDKAENIEEIPPEKQHA